MKSIACAITLLAVLCHSARLRAQAVAAAPVPVGVAPAANPASEQPLPPAIPEAPGTLPATPPGTSRYPESPNQFGQAQVQRDQAEADYARPSAGFYAAPGMAMVGESGGAGISGFIPAVRSEKALVIRTSDAELDAKTLAATQEDLNIMGRILEKAISQSDEEQQPKAMGIPVHALGRQRARNLQIEGFGALFFLNVNFPLRGPASKTEESAKKEPSSSTWDEAKRELYGPPAGIGASPDGAPSIKEDYDPTRVEKLKSALIEALKNASNMRYLKPDEKVTVVVTSGDGGTGEFGRVVLQQQRLMAMDRAGAAAGMNPFGSNKPTTAEKFVYRTEENNGSVMTIQARKSDMDAFATGKLNAGEVRNKIKVLVY